MLALSQLTRKRSRGELGAGEAWALVTSAMPAGGFQQGQRFSPRNRPMVPPNAFQPFSVRQNPCVERVFRSPMAWVRTGVAGGIPGWYQLARQAVQLC
jgi:hypothetical protein